MTDSHKHISLSSRQEWMLLAVLASIQFTNLMDFVILMPLGPQLMRVFSISPQEFGVIVSAYTFSAGIVGFVAALFVDRFDRKNVLLTVYGGFAMSNLLCAIAPSYGWLLFGRIVAGAFGGMMGATVFAVIGDVIPEIRRGAAMGTVMTSFSVATVAGVPVGLLLANSFGWHIPFFMLAISSSIVLTIGYYVLPQIRGHLVHRTKESPVRMLFELLKNRNHLIGFAFISAVVLAGFAVIPYLSPYLVSNVGLPENDLPYVYLFGGGATIFTSRFFGRLADKYGKQKVFSWIAGGSVIPILLVTNLPRLPIWGTLAVTTFFMVLVSGRGIPAMALLTASVEPRQRGSFMSINFSVQQISAGFASFGGGLILGKSATGELTHFGIVGVIAFVTSFASILLSKKIRIVDRTSAGSISSQEASFESV